MFSVLCTELISVYLSADSPAVSERWHNLHILPAPGCAGSFGAHSGHSACPDSLHLQRSKKGSKLQVLFLNYAICLSHVRVLGLGLYLLTSVVPC